MNDAHPVHPAWKVVIGLALLWFVTVAVSVMTLVSFRSTVNANQANIDGNTELLEAVMVQQKGGEERSYILRALAGCADIINDGEIEVTAPCTDPRVAAYYPPSICARIEVSSCGSTEGDHDE